MRGMGMACALVVAGVVSIAHGQVAGRAGRPGVGLPGSEANLSAAQTNLNRDKDKLDQATGTKQKVFEASPAYVRAQKDVSDALAADKSAKDAVLAKLQAQPSYAAARKKADQADALAKTDPSAAQTAMSADAAVSKMENAAYALDEGVKAADAKLAEARQALQKLKSDQDTKMRTDPELQKMRDAIAKDQTEVDSWSARVTGLQNAKPKKGK